MIIRSGNINDAEKMLDMLDKLDNETKYMMFEPGEIKGNIENIKAKLNSNPEEQITLIIDDGKNIGGFLSAQRGNFNRIKHTAYIVIGLLKDYRGKQLGTKMFKLLDKWALENNITRLELTVVSVNIPAIKLYEKMGFVKEGIRKNAMKVDNIYVDELYMARILN